MEKIVKNAGRKKLCTTNKNGIIKIYIYHREGFPVSGASYTETYRRRAPRARLKKRGIQRPKGKGDQVLGKVTSQ